ncbi:MAG: SPFH domain-containing protein [Oligoflexales bacterium]
MLTISLVILGILLIHTAIVVPGRHAYVKERLGRFAGIMTPGLHILIPFFDRVAYRHEIREQVIDVPSQSCITKDNIQLEVDGVIYLKVMDPKLASYGIENYTLAAVNLAQTTMRSEIGKLDLHATFSEREKLNNMIVQEIDKASSSWGIKVLRYELMNITPSEQIIHTLEKAMEAERERRAEVTLASAHKESVSLLSEGERQESIAISEGEKQKRINEAEGRAAHISIIAEATAYSIEKVAEAINTPGGAHAVQARVTDQFITEYEKIITTANVKIVPESLAQMHGFFEGIGQVSQSLNHAETPS